MDKKEFEEYLTSMKDRNDPYADALYEQYKTFIDVKLVKKCCKTCKFWGFPEESEDKYNQCFCDKLTYMSDVGEFPPIDGLATYHEWDDRVFTGPEFGCIHWEERLLTKK